MSTINIKSMEWGNAFSYGPDNKIDFVKERVTQILGINGAGKSSIPLILEEGLYNKNSKGFKKSDIPNRHLNDPYYIYVEYDLDNTPYRLEVNKGSTLKASLYENGEDISAHTASQTIKMFETAVNLDFKTFTQLIYQSTKSHLQFLTATDSKRKEFLVQLFDQTEYGEKYVKYNNVLKEINKDITKLSGSIETTKNNLNRIEQQVNIAVGEEMEEVEFPEDLVQEVSDIRSRIDNIEATNKKKAAENKILTELSKLRTPEEIKADLDALGDIENDSDHVEKLGRRNANISAAKAVVAKVEKVSGQCPTCLQTVDAAFIQSLIDENEAIMSENRAAAKRHLAKIEEIKKLKQDKKRLEVELSQRENLESRKVSETYQELEDHEELEVQLAGLNSEINSVKTKIEKVRAHNAKVQADSAKKQAAMDNLDETSKELEALVENLGDMEKKVGPLETLKKAFSPTGLVAYKLENRVKDLELFTNEYLAKLSDGRFNLSFELEKDKLNVVILDEGVSVPITCLSSGEEARIVIGTLLGIRAIMQSISKTTINILFLDEVISVMDDLGKERLVEVLLEEENLNTFLVSHSWAHPLADKLEVVQEDGISVIRR